MTEYLELRPCIEPKIVGVRTGLGAAYVSQTFYEQNQWYRELFGGEYATQERLMRWAHLPDYGQPLLRLTLHKAGKLTDLVDAGLLFGFIVSDKLRLLLEQHKLPRHRYFEVTFTRTDQEFSGYWWLLYDLEGGRETVDFAQSEFDYSWHTREFGREFSVTSYQEHIALVQQAGQVARATNLVFNQNFDSTLDLWGPHLLWLHRGYISPKLAQAFQQHGITGYSVRAPRDKMTFSY
jgi:hypothetical protein